MDILSRMTDAEIRSLRRQARTMGRHDVAAMCRKALEARRLSRKQRAMPDPFERDPLAFGREVMPV